MNGLRKLLVPMALVLPLLGHAIDVTAKSAIVIDAATGKVLWAKDADALRYPASTTKIMTALLLLEHCSPDEIITAPGDVTKIKEASMHLKPFEQVTAHDILYAMMLRSANDACYAVACHVAGSVPAFSKMMNDRAKQLGCTHTHFDNPNGLNDALHYTSAHDLALIAREAMKREDFRQVVRTYKYEIHRSIDQKDRMMVSHNKWLAKDATADGIKTGYTVPAGHCYVGSATREGYRVITVVMFSGHWQLDHETMLRWAFGTHARMPLLRRDVPVDSEVVSGGVRGTVKVAPVDDVDSLVDKQTLARTDYVPQTRIEMNGPLRAPVRKGDVVGTVYVTDPEGFEQKAPLAAAEDVEPLQLAGKAGKSSGGMALIGGALLAGTIYVRGRARRFRFNGTKAFRSRSF
jgi:serine-type D-Ala-D-Ala carboxypeptidase (penicillin-binding protein 5/6)